MVRAPMTRFFEHRSRPACPAPVRALAALFSGALFLFGGCALAPRAQMDECQQQARTLRSENARLKDQLLVLQTQNRDYADRALDDSRRLATQDQAIERLESSVQAYQDERARLESAFHRLSSSLGETRARADNPTDRAAGAAVSSKQPRSESKSAGREDGQDRERVR
jgi:chromosome segregation ATPase